MALQFDGTNYGNYGDLDSFLDGRTNLSLSLWFYQVSDPTAPAVIVGNNRLSGASTEGVTIWADDISGGSTDVYRSSSDNSSIIGDNESIVNATWQNIFWSFEGGTEARLFVDNTEQANSPDALTEPNFQGATLDDFVVGARPGFETTFHLASGCRLAEFAIWDRLLTADERAALLLGYVPEFFSGKIFYTRFRNAADTTDLVGGKTMTEVGAGALTTGDGPRLILPAAPNIITVAAAPPSGLTIPVAAYHYNHHLGSMN